MFKYVSIFSLFCGSLKIQSNSCWAHSAQHQLIDPRSWKPLKCNEVTCLHCRRHFNQSILKVYAVVVVFFQFTDAINMDATQVPRVSADDRILYRACLPNKLSCWKYSMENDVCDDRYGRCVSKDGITNVGADTRSSIEWINIVRVRNMSIVGIGAEKQRISGENRISKKSVRIWLKINPINPEPLL